MVPALLSILLSIAHLQTRKIPARARSFLLGVGLGNLDGNGLALGKQFVVVVILGGRELGDRCRLGAIVGDEGLNTLDRSTVRSLDLDINTVRVQLTVADGIVPEPLEGGLAGGSILGDGNTDRVRARVGDTAQALTDQGLDDDPGLAIVVGQSPLTVSTSVSSTNVVGGLDGRTGLDDSALLLDTSVLLVVRGGEKKQRRRNMSTSCGTRENSWSRCVQVSRLYLADWEVDGVVGSDRGSDVVIRASSSGGASSEGTIARARGLQGDVGVNGQSREAGQGSGHESSL